jgi:hypothetical protein
MLLDVLHSLQPRAARSRVVGGFADLIETTTDNSSASQRRRTRRHGTTRLSFALEPPESEEEVFLRPAGCKQGSG